MTRMANVTTVARLQVGNTIILDGRIGTIIAIFASSLPRKRVLWIRCKTERGMRDHTRTWGLTKKVCLPEIAHCLDCNTTLDRLEVFPQGRCVECHARVTPLPTLDQFIAMWRGN